MQLHSYTFPLCISSYHCQFTGGLQGCLWNQQGGDAAHTPHSSGPCAQLLCILLRDSQFAWAGLQACQNGRVNTHPHAQRLLSKILVLQNILVCITHLVFGLSFSPRLLMRPLQSLIHWMKNRTKTAHWSCSYCGTTWQWVIFSSRLNQNNMTR